MREWNYKDIKVLKNRTSGAFELPAEFRFFEAEKAVNFHRQIEGYSATPLYSLKGLAEKLQVKGIYIKDESGRFSLNAFKGLGGSYAMFRIICEKLSLDPGDTTLSDLKDIEYRDVLKKLEFVTCTDGNHGKGVSWAAGLFGCRAHVYMPSGTLEVRAEAVREAGPAEVTVTEMNYDDTVRYAKEKSEKNGWILIQDTAWDGYEEIPTRIIEGYLTMVSEAVEEMDALSVKPTHVFLQAGVGSMAGGVISCMEDRYGRENLITAVVEADVADCIYRSVKADDGKMHSVGGAPVTIMAGLNCGTPCKTVWPVFRDGTDYFISISDHLAEEGMRLYAAGIDGDPSVISGGSGASTLGAFNHIMNEESMEEVRSSMNLGRDSVIFLINTEGNTDPESYERVINRDGVK